MDHCQLYIDGRVTINYEWNVYQLGYVIFQDDCDPLAGVWETPKRRWFKWSCDCHVTVAADQHDVQERNKADAGRCEETRG